VDVAVIDYRAGNLRSVQTAFRHLGAQFAITDRPEDVARARRLLVPGVGEARAAMEELERSGLAEAVRDFIAGGRPTLGICLGSQLVFERSEERDTPCLGLLPGVVRRFPSELRCRGLKIPHMGWNRVYSVRRTDAPSPHPLLAGIPDGAFFYFVHSFYPEPAGLELVLAECDYGLRFAAGVGRRNLAAFQFHPEKSGPAGLRLLANFLEWRP
jgi:glutamine amidotransferase